MCGIFSYFNDTIEEGQIDFICFFTNKCSNN